MNEENINKINYAKKVVISLVKSPLYNETSVAFDDELKIYFDSPKIFQLNDFFQLKSIQEAHLYFQFKITDVEPKELKDLEFLIDNKQTDLAQTGSSVIDKWLWFNKPKIECLNSYVNELDKIIRFYDLHHQSSDILPILLMYGPRGSGKNRIVESVCSNLNLHLCKFHFLFKLKDINEINRRIVSSFFQLISQCKSKKSEHNFFIICTTNSKQSIDGTINSYFNYELEIKSLNEQQRKDFLKQEIFENDKINEIIKEIRIESILNELLKKTNGLFYGEIITLSDFIKEEIALNTVTNEIEFLDLFKQALKRFTANRKFQQENKLNIESIGWSDVGGLSDIKEIIIDTILLPLNYPLLFSSSENRLGITRSGILLYGPPGTGKTLLAKAISNECGLNFLSVKGPELLDMYVGQTELNVRNLFEKARINSPCVLFFDELDSLAPIRGRAGDSGGVMDRVVSQLLTEIDGLDKFNSNNQTEKPTQIFLIGATNRPDLIDASLLRPGRFDKLIYVPIPKSFDERFKIFKALIRKLPIDPEFDADGFIKKCPNNLSGADFYSITNKARQHALKRLIQTQEDGLEKLKEDLIFINEKDFNDSLIEFQPTLNEMELKDYEKYFLSYSNKNK